MKPQPDPLLETKLSIPNLRSDRIPRPHLLSRLDAGLQGGFILLSAPAGFGKTSLLVEWLHSSTFGPGDASTQPLLGTWLSLDEGDNSPAQFFAYLAATLRQVGDGVGEKLSNRIQSLQPPNWAAVRATLINELANSKQHVVLVLDDYQFITHPQIETTISLLLEHLPASLCLVISTRSDPPFLLARLRAQGKLAEIRMQDLRFSEAETAQFLERIVGLELSEEALVALDHRTEGWAAGLQLAGLALRGQRDLEAFLESFTGSHRYILEYLVEEVLSRQPEPVRNFMLQTSILDELNGSLCDSVLERAGEDAAKRTRARDSEGYPPELPLSDLTPWSGSQDILEHLDRSNLFVVPLSQDRLWFRYHHLFTELLRFELLKLEAAGHRGLVNRLHQNACMWYRQNGRLEKATGHAVSSNNPDLAVDCLDQTIKDLLDRSGSDALQHWLDSLPFGLDNTHPWLSAALERHTLAKKLPEPTAFDPEELIEELTPREVEVLKLLCDGLFNQEIAERLFITLNTVKRHTNSIYRKLGVTSRAQAIVRARDLGI